MREARSSRILHDIVRSLVLVMWETTIEFWAEDSKLDAFCILHGS